ncbi:MAG TPA: MotA/TolQ/ExbB proton channel family protein [Spirochaetota bacterium]|nr:MotA/TolQ/ExbB proton channel family protein [Spirochaetota bacterium]
MLFTGGIKRCPKCKKRLESTLLICTHCGAAIVKKARFFEYMITSLIMTLVIFTALYFTFLRFPYDLNNTSMIEIIRRLCNEHWVNETIIFVGLWNVMYMILRLQEYNFQKKAFNLFKENKAIELFKKDGGLKVTNVEQVSFQLVDFLKQHKLKNFLDIIVFERIRKTIYFLKSVPNRDATLSALQYQADIDFNTVDMDFKLLKVFNWALPTFGFFGTVIGISEAISGFARFLQSAGGAELTTEAIKNSLTTVLINLAVAFDTTMMALLFLIVLLPWGSYLENAYSSLLTQIEEYCVTYVMPNIVFEEK